MAGRSARASIPILVTMPSKYYTPIEAKLRRLRAWSGGPGLLHCRATGARDQTNEKREEMLWMNFEPERMLL